VHRQNQLAAEVGESFRNDLCGQRLIAPCWLLTHNAVIRGEEFAGHQIGSRGMVILVASGQVRAQSRFRRSHTWVWSMNRGC
jgi:hypothetical protein